MVFNIRLICCFAAIFVLTILSAAVDAQPPGRGGYDRGGSDRGRGGFDPSGFISRMDANGNGSLEPDEISDRAKGFLLPRLKEQGIDTSKPIPISKITESFQKMREQRESAERKADEQPEPSSGLLGDFSGDADDTPLVPDFSLPDDSPLLRSGPLEERYSREVLERADRTLRDYDRNRNGSLESSEMRGGRWSPSPTASDLNKDGKLTRIELAERYKAKYGGGSDRDRDSRRDSDRSRSREEESRKSSSSGTSSNLSRSSSSRSDSSRSSRSSSSGDSKNDKIVKYAKSIMDKYDKNKNGKLEEDEYKGMRGKPERSDKNKDKVLSMDELIVSYGGTPGKSSSKSTSTKAAATKRIGGGNRVPTLKERLEESGVSSKYIEMDDNHDGNVQMAEYSKSWDDKKLEEFDELDSNRDGVISPSEWVDNGGK